ncbi:MAG: hypothetical protein M3R36_01770 [Bacteroidota bacterium]|nr:hypothetical protein [Bacteroidota bacterium]
MFKNVTDILDLQWDLMRLRRDIYLRIEPHPFSEVDFNNTDPLAKEISKYGIEI